jgi:hypothetical protein
MDDLIFKTAGTDREIEACFPVMAELRPHLKCRVCIFEWM